MCAIASPLNYVVLEQPRQLVGADKFWNLSRSMLPVMKKLPLNLILAVTI